jgi:hypothetical protein
MLQRIRSNRVSPASALAVVALFVSLGGTGYAAVKINGKDIKNGTIASSKLKNKAVTSAKIRNNAVTAAKIKNGAIGGAKVNAASLGKVPSAAAADQAGVAQQAKAVDTVKGSNGKLVIGETRTIVEHGPLSVVARCANVDVDPGIELMFYVASSEPGAWFSSWEDASQDFGPTTPETERELTATNWNEDVPGGVFDYDNPADAAFSVATASGVGFNAFPAGIVDADSGCRYAVNANITG